MAYSNKTYTGDGSTKLFTVTFPYIDPSHVTVKVNNTPVSFSFQSKTVLELTEAPGAGAFVQLERNSNPEARLVDFQDDSMGTEALFNLNSDQLLFLTQETADKVMADTVVAQVQALTDSAMDSAITANAKLAEVEAAIEEAGLGPVSFYRAYSYTETPADSPYAEVSATPSDVRVSADKFGAGVYLPLSFYTSGVERVRLSTAGDLGIGGVAATRLHVISVNPGTPETTGAGVTGVSGRFQNGNINLDLGTLGDGTCFLQARLSGDNASNYALALNPNGGGVTTPGVFKITGPTGSIGYGAGSGAFVLQTTSKTTPVTLNRPTGTVVMHNASLAANASVNLIVTNNQVAKNDIVYVNHNNIDGGTGGAYIAQTVNVSNGAFAFRLTNISGGALAELVAVNFVVIKGAAA